ncbi:hypothetical protein ACFWZ2_41295, partial [Streptomyces sp. NPDC059002]
MTAWMRCYWDEEDVRFYFELDAAGWVTRQVELQGPRLVPVAAAGFARHTHRRRRRGDTGDRPAVRPRERLVDHVVSQMRVLA